MRLRSCRQNLSRDQRCRAEFSVAHAAVATVVMNRGATSRRRKHVLQVFVRDNNVDQALKVLKRRLQREGVFREMKRKRFYEKPSERSAREKGEAIRRIRKLKRKQAQREGLLPAPKKKVLPGRVAGRVGRAAPRR
jgi:small subunit ribosomal protein S21